jgi:hypothetical protein
LGLSHGTVVIIMQELGLHKTGAQWVPRARSEDHKVQRIFIAFSFLQHSMPFMVTIFSNALLLETTWFHPSLHRDKLCKLGVETSQAPAIKKFKDGQVCWQSDIYGVLGPQGCTVGGFHVKWHNNQCSIILGNPRMIMSSH